MILALCSYPTGESADPCRKKAVAEYVLRDDVYPRCRLHDSERVQAEAEERGFVRRAIEAAA